MTSLSHDDGIEVLSTSADYVTLTDNSDYVTLTDNADYVTLTDNAGDARIPGTRLYSATLRRAGREEKERQTKEEKRIARAVMVVAGTLIILSVVLVGVTLSMSDHIDEMGECLSLVDHIDEMGECLSLVDHIDEMGECL